jgi:hypothetical protein
MNKSMKQEQVHTLAASNCKDGRSKGRIKSCIILSVINLPTSGIPAEITSLI